MPSFGFGKIRHAPLIGFFTRGDQPFAGKRSAVVCVNCPLIEKRRPSISFPFFQQPVVDLGLVRRRVDFLTGGEADFFIEFFEGDADRIGLGFLQVDMDIVLVDEFLSHSLRRTQIPTAAA